MHESGRELLRVWATSDFRVHPPACIGLQALTRKSLAFMCWCVSLPLPAPDGGRAPSLSSCMLCSRGKVVVEQLRVFDRLLGLGIERVHVEGHVIRRRGGQLLLSVQLEGLALL